MEVLITLASIGLVIIVCLVLVIQKCVHNYRVKKEAIYGVETMPARDIEQIGQQRFQGIDEKHETPRAKVDPYAGANLNERAIEAELENRKKKAQ